MAESYTKPSIFSLQIFFVASHEPVLILVLVLKNVFSGKRFYFFGAHAPIYGSSLLGAGIHSNETIDFRYANLFCYRSQTGFDQGFRLFIIKSYAKLAIFFFTDGFCHRSRTGFDIGFVS